MKTLMFAFFALAGSLFAAQPAYETFISHRGESIDAPENTLPAFKTAVERGFGFECDVYLSADKRVFTFHDRSLTRTTNGACTNKCSEASWETTISKLDVGGWGKWKGSKFSPTRPALLEEVLELATDGRQIYVEVKPGPEIVPYIKEIFAKQKKATPKNTLFITFNRVTCKALKEQMPEYKAYWLTGSKIGGGKTAKPITTDYLLSALKFTKADGVDCHFNPEIVTADLIKTIRDAGYEFHVWTINSLETSRLAFERGAQTVTTDCAKKQLDEFNNNSATNAKSAVKTRLLRHPWKNMWTGMFLVEGPTGCILIDTALEDAVSKTLEPALKESNLTLDSIGLILNTHSHSDHVLCNEELKKRLPNAKFGLPPPCRFKDYKVKPDIKLTDGLVVSSGGVELRVIATPGHSADSVSLLEPTTGALFTGDSLQGRGSESVGLALITDFDAYFKTLDKLSDLARKGIVRSLSLGHSEPPSQNGYVPQEEVLPFLDACRQTAASYLKEGRAFLKANPKANAKQLCEHLLQTCGSVKKPSSLWLAMIPARTVIAHHKAAAKTSSATIRAVTPTQSEARQ